MWTIFNVYRIKITLRFVYNIYINWSMKKEENEDKKKNGRLTKQKRGKSGRKKENDEGF